MDQDSFRKLLQTPKAGTSNPHSRGSLLTTTSKPKRKTVDATQPAFKPRTVNKKSQGAHPYRDRASERRLGLENDYAQVEALAEDFERRNADNIDRNAVEEQRRYLGGDGTHSVLVKGLDFALFEQNRVREAASTAVEDDASLETAFKEASSSIPRKRTREEIVQELKTKRTKTGNAGGDADSGVTLPGEVEQLEEAKKAGKFKPIGFKSIDNGAAEKPKKKVKQKYEGKSGRGVRKKKDLSELSSGKKSPPRETILAAIPSTPIGPSSPPENEAEPIEEDFDIFDGAGEYTGVDLGDDDESDGEAYKDRLEKESRESMANEPSTRGGWFATDDDDRQRSLTPPRKSAEPSSSSVAEPPSTAIVGSDKEEDEIEERPMRLQPLASSALPSIRDLLELDSATEKANKRRARKEKNKDKRVGGGVKTDKDKLERDYKRLKAYSDKKAAADGGKA